MHGKNLYAKVGIQFVWPESIKFFYGRHPICMAGIYFLWYASSLYGGDLFSMVGIQFVWLGSIFYGGHPVCMVRDLFSMVRHPVCMVGIYFL